MLGEVFPISKTTSQELEPQQHKFSDLVKAAWFRWKKRPACS